MWKRQHFTVVLLYWSGYEYYGRAATAATPHSEVDHAADVVQNPEPLD
jgi:hypothetical protein